ncbi:Gamma-glutamylaminecyclotransferase [Holothuria leucospilota]|uniref:Gamma-glutamylcyclotransferase family protein n=1 Tax=Holothuria leucospilota TaxID=206669 RepID=A0A9Q1HLJ6_HOLLE|nr:Gamma-glutamylaminecyclotransferase [Holothuria leucospilota]
MKGREFEPFSTLQIFSAALVMYRIFIYGTLKANEMNSFHMTDDSHGKTVFVGKGKTSERYPLVLVAFKQFRNIPGMIYQEGVGHHIDGEIWDVDETFLKWLDNFEGYPDVYRRETLKITRADGSGEDTCLVYIKCNVQISESSNLLTSYNSAECGRPYIPS